MPSSARTRADLRRFGIAIAIAGIARWILSVARRLIAGRVSLGVEVLLRQSMYDHLQSLELGFFDRQQTGQLMSRATVDLQSVRFFLGYGLVWILPVGADDLLHRRGDDRHRSRCWRSSR